MGDLSVDTAVTRVGEGRYTAVLSKEWEIWGPMGGYVAAVALRAAGAESPFDRPASFFCHYLSVAAFEAVDVEVTVLRQARTACSHRVEVSQGGKPVLEATVWSVGEVDGLEHHWAEPPGVAQPEHLVPVERLVPEDAPPPFPFWNNLESRPLEFREDWPPPEPLPPTWRTWARFRPTATFADPWVDACRSVVLVDVQSWPSATGPHAWNMPPFIAPSLDLYVAFHQPVPDEEWLLADGHGPVAKAGLMGWTGRLWSTGGDLVASGAGQLLCRRLPNM